MEKLAQDSGGFHRRMQWPELRPSPGVLVGIRSGDVAGMNTTYRQQFKVMTEFRKGGINCLVQLALIQDYLRLLIGS